MWAQADERRIRIGHNDIQYLLFVPNLRLSKFRQRRSWLYDNLERSLFWCEIERIYTLGVCGLPVKARPSRRNEKGVTGDWWWISMELERVEHIWKPEKGSDFELLPCPFCEGTEVVYYSYNHIAGERFGVFCCNCTANIDPGYAQDRCTVQHMWNRRSKVAIWE